MCRIESAKAVTSFAVSRALATFVDDTWSSPACSWQWPGATARQWPLAALNILGALDEVAGIAAQGTRQPGYQVQGGVALTSLQRADVTAVDVSIEGELLLAEAERHTPLTNTVTEELLAGVRSLPGAGHLDSPRPPLIRVYRIGVTILPGSL